MITADIDASVSFLRCWVPKGWWVLTAIIPDGITETRTFGPKDESILRRWLAGCADLRNIYYSVNMPKYKLTKKALKSDIGYMLALHVDVDPAKDGDLVKERAKILERVQNFKPKPSIIIDSGGGYQAFFLLREPVPVEDATSLESFNKQLEIELGGDHCANLDRIMRLPGTINIPNKKKRNAGRKPALAKLVSADWDLRYDLADFTPAPVVEASDSNVRVSISGNLPIVDLDTLEGVSDDTKMLIIHGDDPDRPERYGGDRSKAVWRVLIEFAKADLSDDVIASILLDRDQGISAHVRDQRRPEAYLTRQIARAREAAVDPDLEKLNRNHFVAWEGNARKVYIGPTNDPVTGRRSFRVVSYPEFRSSLIGKDKDLGVDAKNKPLSMPLAQWWLRHDRKREYISMIFAPNRDVSGYYNLWRGFAVDPKPGDWSLYREHVFQNVCGGDQSSYDYILGWLARAVQHPGTTGDVAIVMRGERGVGKGIFARIFGDLFGSHFLAISQESHLTGNFNAHLRDVVVLFCDEAFWAGDKKGQGVLKTLITEPELTIEAKGVDVISAPNCLHVIMSSNAEWVVPAGHEERRYMVLEVGLERQRDTKFFQDLKAQMAAGGLAALLHDLMQHDLGGFKHRDPPETAALLDQKHRSMEPEESWWYDKLQDGIILEGQASWPRRVGKDALQADYCEKFKRRGLVARQWKTMMGIFLAKVLPKGYPKTITLATDITRDNGRLERAPRKYYAMPTLAESRAAFDAFMRAEHDWPTEEVVEEDEQTKLMGAVF